MDMRSRASTPTPPTRSFAPDAARPFFISNPARLGIVEARAKDNRDGATFRFTPPLREESAI